MAKSKKNQSVWPIFLLIVMPLSALGVSSYAIYRGIQSYITTSKYFSIKDVAVEGISDVRYVTLMKEEILGTNIFCVDAVKLAERIKRRFPTFYYVAVERLFPSGLRIVAKERKPVALIKTDAYYLFDTDGYVLSSFPLDALVQYPVIVGLTKRWDKMRVGGLYISGSLKKGLELARQILMSSPFSWTQFASADKLQVTTIDVSDIGNLSFYLGNEIQIKIGDRDFQKRLELLPMILKNLGDDIPNIRYIDLRPKEPVIATKSKKK